MALFYTVGHSTRSADAFVSALQTHGVDAVVDVFGPDRADDHDLTRFAVVDDGQVVYPEEADS